MNDYRSNIILNDRMTSVIRDVNRALDGCIDAMEQVFGIEAVKHFCLLNWFKYNFRHELKNGQEDMDKASWYFEKYRELLNR